MMPFKNLPNLPPEKRRSSCLHPRASVVNIIRRIRGDTRHYLLIKRNSQPYLGMWAMVGGKWDFGEELAGVAIREVQEETGLTTTFIAFKGMVNVRVAPETDEQKGGHFLMFVCEVEMPADGIASEQGEGEVGWFLPSEIEALHQQSKIIPSDYKMLHQFAWSPHQRYVEARMVQGENDAKLVGFDIKD